MNAPLVSIVMATYNRSNIVRFSIESVRRSTVRDWELLVVGDACTDDTERVVRSFGDSRIQFVNLARHCGEQSGPNNEGVRRARGRYVAFLNHDDFWTPDHLAVALRGLEQTGADLVFTLPATIDHLGRTRIAGVTRTGVYDRRAASPASTWLLRRELVDAIGEWRPASELFLSPSTEWLVRASRAGRKLASIEVVTAIIPFSGGRRHAYSQRQSAEHERIAERLRSEPRFVQDLVTTAAVEMTRERQRGVAPHLVRAVRNAVYATLAALGVDPAAVVRALRYRRKGGFLDHLRRRRGLPPLPRERSS